MRRVHPSGNVRPARLTPFPPGAEGLRRCRVSLGVGELGRLLGDPAVIAAIWFGEPSRARCSSASSAASPPRFDPGLVQQASCPIGSREASGPAISRPARAPRRRGSVGDAGDQPELLGLGPPRRSRPVKVSSLATSIETSRGSVRVRPMSGIRPHLISRIEKRGIGRGDPDVARRERSGRRPRTRRRAWRRSPASAAAASRARRPGRGSRCRPREGPSSSSTGIPASKKLGTSRPEQKLGPSPERTTARTSRRVRRARLRPPPGP